MARLLRSVGQAENTDEKQPHGSQHYRPNLVTYVLNVQWVSGRPHCSLAHLLNMKISFATCEWCHTRVRTGVTAKEL